MKTPSAALFWEIWWKHRWGFALLVLLLAACAALSRYVVLLEARASRLATEAPYIVRYSLTGTTLLQVLTGPVPAPAATVDAPKTDRYAPTPYVWPQRYEMRRESELNGLPPLRYGRVPTGSNSPPFLRGVWSLGPPQNLRFDFGSVRIYDGLLRPEDVLAWASVPGREREGVVRFSLNRTNLYEGVVSADGTRSEEVEPPRSPEVADSAHSLRPDELLRRYSQAAVSWTRADGHRGAIRLDPQRELPAEWTELSASSVVGREAALAWGTGLLAFSFLVLCVIFAGAEPHRVRGFTGIPPRRFALPVPTSSLMIWPIVLGVLTLWLLWAGWSELVFRPLLKTDMPTNDVFLAMLLAAGLVVFQALVWGLASFPKLRAVSLTVLVLALIVVAASFESIPISPDPSLEATERAAILVCAALIGLGSLAAWFGVRLERRGHWASWRGWTAASLVPAALRVRPDEFGAPLRAQVWIEWRRNARLPLALWTGAVLGVVALVVTAGSAMPQSTLSDGVLNAFLLLAPVWLAITGLNLARDGGSRQLALSSFTATRPVTTGTLVLAKLLAGAALWLFAVALAGVAGLVMLATVGFERGVEVFTALIVLAFSLHLFTGILPLCLSGRIAGFPWSLAPLVLIYGALLNVLAWCSEHPERYSALFGVLVVSVVIKLVASYWGFRRSLALKLISTRFVTCYAATWLVGAGVLAAMAWRFCNRCGWEGSTLLLIPGALLALPLARIAVSPLALALNRHR